MTKKALVIIAVLLSSLFLISYLGILILAWAWVAPYSTELPKEEQLAIRETIYQKFLKGERVIPLQDIMPFQWRDVCYVYGYESEHSSDILTEREREFIRVLGPEALETVYYYSGIEEEKFLFLLPDKEHIVFRDYGWFLTDPQDQQRYIVEFQIREEGKNRPCYRPENAFMVIRRF